MEILPSCAACWGSSSPEVLLPLLCCWAFSAYPAALRLSGNPLGISYFLAASQTPWADDSGSCALFVLSHLFTGPAVSHPLKGLAQASLFSLLSLLPLLGGQEPIRPGDYGSLDGAGRGTGLIAKVNSAQLHVNPITYTERLYFLPQLELCSIP